MGTLRKELGPQGEDAEQRHLSPRLRLEDHLTQELQRDLTLMGR